MKPGDYNFLKKNVKIFVEDNIKDPNLISINGAYHANAHWLRFNKKPAYWEKSVQIAVPNYLKLVKRQPAVLLHELAHAFHHQKLGIGYQPIKDAYERAKASGKYQRV